MDTSEPEQESPKSEATQDIEEVDIKISKGDITSLHPANNHHAANDSNDEEAGHPHTISPAPTNNKDTLSNILNDGGSGGDIMTDDESQALKVKVNKQGDTMEYHTDDDMASLGAQTDTLRWFRMGTDRSDKSDTTPRLKHKDTMYELIPTVDEQWEEFVKHLRHAASYKAEYDIYQVLAYRAKVSHGQKIYIKPFKNLKGLVSEKWSDFEVRWLNSFQRVLCQAIICFCIQTLGVTAILITQFSAYFAEDGENAQCDYHGARWKSDWHLKLLAFLWTSFISLGVSGWVYRARHSGFYPILLFLRRDQYPNFVSIEILQIGLLCNYYVVASSVIGSFILIYQTEGGTETIDMILQAVALFFVLELDNKIVHSRDFLSIRKYFDLYIKNNKHKKLPHGVLKESTESMFQKPLKSCKGNSCLSGTLAIATFLLLVFMTIGAFIAPWLIMICW